MADNEKALAEASWEAAMQAAEKGAPLEGVVAQIRNAMRAEIQYQTGMAKWETPQREAKE